MTFAFDPIGISFDFDQLPVLDEPFGNGRGDSVVLEDFAPVFGRSPAAPGLAALKALLVVRMTEPLLALLDMTWKKRSRPCLSSGMCRVGHGRLCRSRGKVSRGPSPNRTCAFTHPALHQVNGYSGFPGFPTSGTRPIPVDCGSAARPTRGSACERHDTDNAPPAPYWDGTGFACLP